MKFENVKAICFYRSKMQYHKSPRIYDSARFETSDGTIYRIEGCPNCGELYLVKINKKVFG